MHGIQRFFNENVRNWKDVGGIAFVCCCFTLDLDYSSVFVLNGTCTKRVITGLTTFLVEASNVQS